MDSNENKPQRLLLKVVIDIICLLLVGIPILIFYLKGKPYKRGFFCDDESLRHPYIDSTVPSWALYIFGLGLPILAIICTEFVIFKCSGAGRKVIINIDIPGWIWESYCHIGIFGFGAACSQLTTDIAKYTIGRLRPHFYTVCQPDIDCLSPNYKNVYIEDFKCRGSNEHLLKDMRLSFPSGHASFSTYCMVYLVAYLQSKLQWRGSKLLKHTLQFIALSLAIYTSLSRISDYKHHWSDVLGGAIQGILVAFLIVAFVSNLFPHQNYKVVGQVLGADSDSPDNGMHMMERKNIRYHNNSIM